MELEQLRHFVEVVERGSFTRAASWLNVNQPLLSRQIRRLETEMRTVLLYRTGRGVRPTDAGLRLANTARNILQQLETVVQGNAEGDSELQGRVVVGMPPSLGRVLTVPYLRAFTARFPNATLVIVEALSRPLYDSLLSERVDLALLHDQISSPAVHVETIAMDPLCLISPRGEQGQGPRAPTIAFAEVCKLPLIFPCAPNPIRMTVEAAAASQGGELDIRHEIDGIDAILQLVLEGFGSAIANANIVAKTRFADCFSMQRIVSPALKTVVSLARPARRQGALYDRTAELMREVAHQTLIHDHRDEQAPARGDGHADGSRGVAADPQPAHAACRDALAWHGPLN